MRVTAIVIVRFQPHEEEDIPKSVGRIHVNFSYLERVKYPYLATLIHERTHVNEQYKGCPDWLNEGIADYIRHEYFERDIELKLPSIGLRHRCQGYGTIPQRGISGRLYQRWQLPLLAGTEKGFGSDYGSERRLARWRLLAGHFHDTMWCAS